MTRAFEYHHVVGFEDTNLVGNVYYLNHLRWQGRCRELFLYQHCPGVLAELRDGLRLVTLSCACDYLAELCAFDRVTVRMRLGALGQTQLDLRFDYVRPTGAGGEELVARGHQRLACMRLVDGKPVPARVPDQLRDALRAFDGAGPDQRSHHGWRNSPGRGSDGGSANGAGDGAGGGSGDDSGLVHAQHASAAQQRLPRALHLDAALGQGGEGR